MRHSFQRSCGKIWARQSQEPSWRFGVAGLFASIPICIWMSQTIYPSIHPSIHLSIYLGMHACIHACMYETMQPSPSSSKIFTSIFIGTHSLMFRLNLPSHVVVSVWLLGQPTFHPCARSNDPRLHRPFSLSKDGFALISKPCLSLCGTTAVYELSRACNENQPSLSIQKSSS